MKSAPPAGIIGFPGAAVGAIPFVFPFAPLGLGLFDTDPQRLLSLLHQQSALAEEAIRYRSVLFGVGAGAGVGSSSASLGAAQPGVGFLPLLDDYKEPLNLHTPTAAETSAAAAGANPTPGSPFDLQLEVPSKTGATSISPAKAATTIRVRDGLVKEGFYDDGKELLLHKPSALASATYGMASASCSSSTSSSSLCDPDSLALFRDVPQLGGCGSPTAATTTTTTATATVATTGDTKCHICMANFPSVWLLEQHAALQHPHLTIHDDKPYLCGLCGQKSRYTCCRYRTVLAKHHRAEPGGRSRVPADKLFTCDVCGMQFRYLKSFKKHRLNHALERLHGKKGVVPTGPGSVDSEPAVSSTNEGGAEASSSGLAMGDAQGHAAAEPDTAPVSGTGGKGHAASDEQDDTVSDSARKQSPPVVVECAPSTAGIEESQPKISSSISSSSSSSSSSSTSSSSNNGSVSGSIVSSNASSCNAGNAASGPGSTRTSDFHSNGALSSEGPVQGAVNGGSSCQASSSSGSGSTGDLRPAQPSVDATNEAQLAGELKRYQTASAVAAVQHHGSVVRSMEAESSGLLHHCIAPSTSASAGAAAAAAVAHASASNTPGSLGHTLNSLINAETIPHHRLLGLDPQEASILNFLRVDAAEKQRDRRFACPFCGKCVRSKENLKLHVRKHTGERPFVCLFCGRAFGGKSDLTRHLRIHTGERPYHCEACGKCFARADYLSKHLTTHVHQLSPRP